MEKQFGAVELPGRYGDFLRRDRARQIAVVDPIARTRVFQQIRGVNTSAIGAISCSARSSSFDAVPSAATIS
jgi:hypothetical protein